MKHQFFLCLFVIVLLLTGCSRQNNLAIVSSAESKEAKALLQGIWIDTETESAFFRVKGDTIYYPDSLSQPAYFKIVNDSMILTGRSYQVIRQAAHLFWFKNQNGELVKLQKSDDPNDALAFRHDRPKALAMIDCQTKKDSVVVFGGERYHWYVAINPTKYRVTKTVYNDEGVGVDNVYYDNIIHISIFKGANKLFSRDIRKMDYMSQVPEAFIGDAILGNMEYESVDTRGFHFAATLCIPDGASCYMVGTDINFDGVMTMKLLEY